MRVAVAPVARIALADVAVTLGALAAAAYAALLGAGLIPPLACPLRALTGVPCPMCGSTHAIVALLRGEPIAALGWNPLALLLAAAAVIVAANELAGIVARRRLRLALSPREGRVLLAAFLAALAGNWAWVLCR